MGEPLRTVVRVKRAEAGYEGRDAGAGSLFIAGNALELATQPQPARRAPDQSPSGGHKRTLYRPLHR